MNKRRIYFWISLIAYLVSMVTGTIAGFKWMELVFSKDQ